MRDGKGRFVKGNFPSAGFKIGYTPWNQGHTKITDERMAKQSAKRIGKCYLSPQEIEKKREMMKQRWQNPKWRAQFSEKAKGRLPNLNHLKRLRQSNMGAKRSATSRKKMSDARIGKYNGEANPRWRGGTQAWQRRQKARRRALGFEPINAPFENCEAHHIDRRHVIYIPKKLHRSVWHSLDKLETMAAINTKVFCWLIIGSEQTDV